MDILSDKLLVETYKKAIELDLEDNFINIIKQEMRRRNLELPQTVLLYQIAQN